MSRGRKKYVPKRFESKGEKFIDENGKLRADTSANIYESLLLSDSFRDLSDRQKMLYIVAKSQYYGHRKPEKDYPEIELFQGADVFYLNWNAVKRYGLYKDSMHSNFYRDMAALIEHGLLWSSFFVTLVAKKYRLATMLPFVPRMVCDSR